MSSDADFQFIVGTILGQKQDSPLFKALDENGINDVGGIMYLSDHIIYRLTYRDESSDPPIQRELGYGYQQLLRCFIAFVKMKDVEGKSIQGDWQNLTKITEFHIRTSSILDSGTSVNLKSNVTSLRHHTSH